MKKLKLPNQFCIRTRGPDESKKIVDTLVELGINRGNWKGDGDGGFYYVIEGEDIKRLTRSVEGIIVLELSDLLSNNDKIVYNYKIL